MFVLLSCEQRIYRQKNAQRLLSILSITDFEPNEEIS